jgi:thiamine-monophosphate kinase
VEPPPGAITVTVDAVVEGVHFTVPEFPPQAIGRKALAAALSDLAAMGAAPGEAYVVLGAPADASDRTLLAIADGLAEVARREQVTVAGGDLVRSPVLSLAITAVGYEQGVPLVTRAGARPGDSVVVTGELGGSAAALGLLGGAAAAESLSSEVRKALLARQLDPRPRLAAGRALADAGATAMIDISDGLGADAGHVARASGCGIEIAVGRVPVAEGVAEVAGGTEAALELAASGGEDFELLATVPADRVGAAGEATASAGVRLTEIGYAVEGDGPTLRRPDGGELEPRGFDQRRGSRSGSGSGSRSADSGSSAPGSGG